VKIWLEWLKPWVGYRSEIERVVDLGDDVLVLVRDFGRLDTGGTGSHDDLGRDLDRA
jgi:hypothetical protein